MTTAKTIFSLTLSGEVSTKSPRTRKRFHGRLCANIRSMLDRHGMGGRVRDHWERIEVDGTDARAGEMLARVFGIQSVRIARVVPWRNLNDLVRTGADLFAARVDGKTFAVRPRRVGPREHIPVDSNALARNLGTALVDAGGRVDLDEPEVPVYVEVRADDALFFEQVIPGPAGLPIGTEGRALALMSGGFDSAVAAWQLLRRGVQLDFLLFNLAGWPQEHAVRRVLDALDKRWISGTRPRLYIVDFRPLIVEMRERVPGKYWQVLLKRMMMRVADRIAAGSKAEALVTGEAIGQVSSQTLSNLRSITAHTETPVVRPLVGMNKDEIIRLAENIGTAEISAGVAEFCALEGGRPLTRTTPGALDAQEAEVGLGLIDALAERCRVVPREAFGVSEADSVELERVPEHATVFDLRSEREYAEWAWPHAIHLEFEKALEHVGALPNDRAYLFYCEVGLKSAFLAEQLRDAGFESYSFRGGVRPMAAYLQRKYPGKARA